ncbi:hydrogenase maturation protease [Asanoa sp. NPDC049518]|uniref:hydrogenase maturation protease n=1 Tax=unclassified Asanoa TaxID=2685164 RepID=UPI003426DF64
MSSVLIAGIGNVFLGDDGFGPAVARHLVERGNLPDQVRVVDYGIRGLHLAYDLLAPASESERSFSLAGGAVDSSKNERSFSFKGDGVAALILIDALPGDDEPGTVTVLTVGSANDVPVSAGVDAHAMDPATVLATVRRLGGTLPPTYVVGCRPANLDEGIGLSPAVAAAVPEAAAAVDVLLGKLTTEGT